MPENEYVEIFIVCKKTFFKTVPDIVLNIYHQQYDSDCHGPRVYGYELTIKERRLYEKDGFILPVTDGWEGKKSNGLFVYLQDCKQSFFMITLPYSGYEYKKYYHLSSPDFDIAVSDFIHFITGKDSLFNNMKIKKIDVRYENNMVVEF